MAKFNFKKGDTVEILAGDDKGTKAEVIAVMPKNNKVIVQVVRLLKKQLNQLKIIQKAALQTKRCLLMLQMYVKWRHNFMARLKEKYIALKPQLQETLDIKNAMEIPGLEKITISVGAGFAMKDNKLIQNIQETISTIAGQHATVVIAKKSVCRF